jgi:regulator of replication initiation timing
LDELLSKAERSVAAAYQDKQELEIENRMLRSELDALRQHLEQRGAQDGEHAKDQETMKYLRQECERIAAECTNLKDTNSQLTRKLSASLKNKVELEKVQTAREQLEVSSSEHMTALL